MKNNKVNTVYRRIREIREDNDNTQAEVAKKLNLHLTQYRRYEKSETPVTADFIKQFAILYNISADYILEITNKKENNKI